MARQSLIAFVSAQAFIGNVRAQYVTPANLSVLSVNATDSFTCGARVKLYPKTVANNNDNHTIVECDFNWGANLGYEFQVLASTGELNVWSGNTAYTSSSNVFTYGLWHTVVFRLSGTTLDAFIDGINVWTVSVVRQVNAGGSNSRFGSEGTGTTSGERRMMGLAEDFFAVKSALTNQQVADLSTEGIYPTLGIRYALNDTSGTTAADSSGNANTGTITGSTWVTADLFSKARTASSRTIAPANALIRTNLFPNPSFESTNSWNLGGAGSHPTSSGIINDTSLPLHGTHNGKIINGDGSSGHLYMQNTSVQGTPAVTYTFSCYVYIPSSSYTSGGLQIVLDDNAFNRLSSGPSNFLLDQWVNLSLTYTIPSGGTPDGTNILRCIIDSIDSPLMTSYYDGAMLEAASVLGTYFDGSTNGGSWTGTANNSASTLTQARFPTSPRNLSVTSTQQYGTNTHSSTTGYSNMIKVGMKWARADFTWTTVEPTQGTFSWTFTDGLVNAAIAAGINLLPILDYSNGWANGNQAFNVPPTDPSTYASYCAAVVTRYAPQGIMTYEIWNEPNTSGFWQPTPDGAAYTTLLKAAYQAMKAVNSNITVLTGGCAPSVTDSTHIAPDIFLQAIYSSGGQNYFDHFNYHPYGWNTTQMNAIRSVMVSNGDANKKIWFTEFGDPTFGSNGESYVSEAQQAADYSNAIKNTTQLSWVGPFIMYEWQDGQAYNDPSPDREGYFGIIRNDGTYKPAVQAIRNAVNGFYL